MTDQTSSDAILPAQMGARRQRNGATAAGSALMAVTNSTASTAADRLFSRWFAPMGS
jgi:hypothetical protein